MGVIDKAANILGTIVHRWRWWYVPVAVVITFVLGWGLLWWVQSSALERRYAEIRAAGHPVTLEELNDYYVLPADVEDNTKLWLEAIRLVTATSSNVDEMKLPMVGDGPNIPPAGQPWAEHGLVVAYLSDHAGALTALHQAADAGGGVRNPHDMRDGYSLLLPEVQALRQCARLLSLEAHVRAHDGDLSGAADSLRATFAVGKTLEREPILVSFLVRIAVDSIAVEQTRLLMSTVELTSDDLRAIQTDLRQTDYAADLHHAMVGERVFGLTLYDDLTVFGFSPVAAQLSKVVVPGASIKHLDLMNVAVAATNEPWHEALLSGSLAAIWKPNSYSPYDYLVGQVLPSIDGCIAIGARRAASTMSLDVAIAAELFRREHGELPEVLADLVPEYLPAVPLDPFDGKPLRYVVEDDAFVIYSVGANLKDDAGDVEHDDATGHFPDVGIRVGPPMPEEESP